MEEKAADGMKAGGSGEEPRFCMSKDKINNLPINAFPGRISVLSSFSSAGEIESAMRILGNSRMLGFDTESRPSFRKGDKNPIALIQLSTDDRAFLFRIHGRCVPGGLKRILENQGILKIGQGLKHELRTLHKELGVAGKGFIDLLDIAHKLDCSPKSVRGLSAIFLGFRITKSAQMSNWERGSLTEKQKLYAATDAWACLKVYEELRRRNIMGSLGKNRHM